MGGCASKPKDIVDDIKPKPLPRDGNVTPMSVETDTNPPAEEVKNEGDQDNEVPLAYVSDSQKEVIEPPSEPKTSDVVQTTPNVTKEDYTNATELEAKDIKVANDPEAKDTKAGDELQPKETKDTKVGDELQPKETKVVETETNKMEVANEPETKERKVENEPKATESKVEAKAKETNEVANETKATEMKVANEAEAKEKKIANEVEAKLQIVAEPVKVENKSDAPAVTM